MMAVGSEQMWPKDRVGGTLDGNGPLPHVISKVALPLHALAKA